MLTVVVPGEIGSVQGVKSWMETAVQAAVSYSARIDDEKKKCRTSPGFRKGPASMRATDDVGLVVIAAPPTWEVHNKHHAASSMTQLAIFRICGWCRWSRSRIG